jgi:predicted amidophosphoribosyltransferase
MKRCALRRKEMALLASEAWEQQLPSASREHIAQCHECQSYWKEINAVCALCASAAEDSKAPGAGIFHERCSLPKRSMR